MTIDSHCHLDQADYTEPVSDVVARARPGWIIFWQLLVVRTILMNC